MSLAPGWPIIPELFSILGYAYYSQNYSRIISSSLVMCDESGRQMVDTQGAVPDHNNPHFALTLGVVNNEL